MLNKYSMNAIDEMDTIDAINYDADSEPDINVFYDIGIFISERNLKITCEQYTSMFEKEETEIEIETKPLNQNVKNRNQNEYNDIEREVFENIGQFLMQQNLAFDTALHLPLEDKNINNIKKKSQPYKNQFYISSDNLELIKNENEKEMEMEMELELELEISSDDCSDSEDNIFPKLKQAANIVLL